MAALLCTAPCRLLGGACQSLVHALSTSCKCLADVLRPLANMLDCLRPFTALTTIAVFALCTPIALTAMAIQADG